MNENSVTNIMMQNVDAGLKAWFGEGGKVDGH